MPPNFYRRFALVLVVFLGFLCGPSGSAQLREEGSDREYALKAAFIFHFTQFVEWPVEAASDDLEARPLRILILAPNPFGTMLDEVVRDERARGRPIEVHYRERFDESLAFDIVFIPEGAGGAGREAVEKTAGQPVLLVGESASFLRRGGMIALIREENRVAIMIHRTTLEAAGLTVSSRLLRLAQVVEDP